LLSAIGSTIGFKLDEAFLTGTGAGTPLGVINDLSLISINKEVGQAADTITYPNLANMFARMYSGGRTRAVWVCNNAAIPQLLHLTIPVGTGGSHISVMTRGPEGFEMLCRPAIFAEKLPTLGDAGNIIFVDFSQYTIGLRHDVRLDASSHVLFATDEVAFRSIVRADGRGSWKEAITPVNGDSLS